MPRIFIEVFRRKLDFWLVVVLYSNILAILKGIYYALLAIRVLLHIVRLKGLNVDTLLRKTHSMTQ